MARVASFFACGGQLYILFGVCLYHIYLNAVAADSDIFLFIHPFRRLFMSHLFDLVAAHSDIFVFRCRATAYQCFSLLCSVFRFSVVHDFNEYTALAMMVAWR